jgi:acetyl-CoA C-acetyltransferase
MTSTRSVVFVNPVRTAIGTFGGSLKEVAAPDLGAAASGPQPDGLGSSPMMSVRWLWVTLSKPA